MKINIFEGGRRIALAFSLLTALITIFYLFSESKTLPIRYNVLNFGGPVVSTDEEECLYPNLEDSNYRQTEDGKDYYISMCFKASKANNGEMLIPYKPAEEKGLVYMSSAFDDEVRTYAKQTVRNFELHQEDISSLSFKYYKFRIWEFLKGIGYLAAGLSIFWIFVSILGWIVRGFLGIPTGRDSKPDPSPPAA